uniref:Ribosome binding factor A n=1 Tax=Molossus molossus TaxID=27622 RepID=A0A7J8HJ16_MOLMO|nr:ribosome binding factor A [Molossus molossus]
MAAHRLWAQPGGLRALLGRFSAGLLPGGARGLHVSPAPCGKNLLKKFASKTKKKFWYEGPSLGSHLTYKPSQLEFLTKSTSKQTRKEDHVRRRALNGLLYKALSDMLCTPEVSQEIYDLNVELSKVSLTSDFSACRVYWRTTASAEQNTRTQAALRRSAAHVRHLLMSQQTLRNVPPIVFVQDKEHAALAEAVEWRSGTRRPGAWRRAQRVGSDAAGGCGLLSCPLFLSRWTGYWQWLILGPPMKKKTFHKVASGTLSPQVPHRQVTPWALPCTRVCVGLIMRHSTSRLWSTRGGRRKRAGVRAQHG